MISSVDASVYLGLIDNIATLPNRSSLVNAVSAVHSEQEDTSSSVDLSDYYTNLESSDMLEQLIEDVATSSENLSDIMIQSLENGMSVQDVVNINCAFQAYNANCQVAKSTFELKI